MTKTNHEHADNEAIWKNERHEDHDAKRLIRCERNIKQCKHAFLRPDLSCSLHN